jgi:hypothetical protein
LVDARIASSGVIPAATTAAEWAAPRISRSTWVVSATRAPYPSGIGIARQPAKSAPRLTGAASMIRRPSVSRRSIRSRSNAETIRSPHSTMRPW